MRTCLVVLSLILAIEGGLAWASGLPQLAGMLGGMVLVGGMASVWKRRGGEWGWAPLVGLYVVATVLAIGIRDCGVIVAASSLHFVAWSFAARAVRFGAPDLIPGTLDGRPGIFAVAFYGALMLAVVLVRGGVFPIDKSLALGLAFALFVLGLAAMEMGRFLRMREGAADRASRKRGIAARALALLAVLGGLFFLFSKPVPAAADGLVKMALALQGKSEDPNLNADDMPDLDDVPETDVTRDDPLGEQPNQEQASGQRAGDSMSQSRKLPQRADVQGSHEPLVYLDLDSEPQAYALAQRPIYVRSSTLGEYADGSWGRVGEGISPRWIFDQQDGREDGTVSLPEEFPRAAQAARVSYKIYVKGSTGAALLAMQGVSEFELPQVMRYDDDWYRSSKIGNIAYRAASRPLSLEDVIGAERLRPGKIAKVYSEVPDSVLMRRIQQLLDNQMPFGSLTERLLWLKQYLEANYQYSTTVANVDNLDPLENFLFEEKRGYCDFYATAAALMVRMMGVPSRIGYGFSKGEFDGEKLFTFYEDGAHSWPEIFLEDQGWVVFDVTPSGQAGGGQAEQPNEPRERPDLSGFEQPENDPLTKDGGNNDPLLSKIDEENSAVSDLVSYLVFCAALLAFALWYYLKRDEAREAEGEVGGSDGKTRKLPAYLAEFCRLVKACGLDPQHGETIVEMMKSLRAVGVPVDGFEEMKRYHYSTRYEDSPLDPGLEKQFLREVKAFVKEKTRSD